ncbi:hypothetical protein C8J56DRAFT_890423 [Mycena floridula]|nr:hypothetical protein C8J56DRAFT_890423 [Mycena floridula]
MGCLIRKNEILSSFDLPLTFMATKPHTRSQGKPKSGIIIKIPLMAVNMTQPVSEVPVSAASAPKIPPTVTAAVEEILPDPTGVPPVVLITAPGPGLAAQALVPASAASIPAPNQADISPVIPSAVPVPALAAAAVRNPRAGAALPISGKAHWSQDEELQFVHFLWDHFSEAGQGSNFKATTYNATSVFMEQRRTTGGPKTADACKNKYTSTVRLDPDARKFRNKGRPLWEYMSRMMPTKIHDMNVFNQIQIDNSQDTQAPSFTDNSQVSDDFEEIKPLGRLSPDWSYSQLDRDMGAEPPEPPRSSPPELGASHADEEEVIIVKPPRKRVSAVGSDTDPKKIRLSATAAAPITGAMALAGIGDSFNSFCNVFEKAFATVPAPGPSTQPQWQPETPHKTLKAAIAKLQKLEKWWMTNRQMIGLMDRFRTDSLAATTYLSLSDDDEEFRIDWVKSELGLVDEETS